MTLACCPFAPPHTAESIYKLFDAVLKDWGINREQVSVVISDNAAAMIATFKNYTPSPDDVRNSSEGNLAYESALADVRELFSDVYQDTAEDDEVIGEIAKLEAFEWHLNGNDGEQKKECSQFIS